MSDAKYPNLSSRHPRGCQSDSPRRRLAVTILSWGATDPQFVNAIPEVARAEHIEEVRQPLAWLRHQFQPRPIPANQAVLRMPHELGKGGNERFPIDL